MVGVLMMVAAGLAPSTPALPQTQALEVPPGIDLDGIMLPEGLDGGAPSPVDQAFDEALAAFHAGDLRDARAEWSELSDAGHGLSTHNLAVMTWRGLGGGRDPAHALALFEEAAAAETAASIHALGVLRLHGIGGEQNAAEAVRLFEAASSLGHTAATYNLAVANLQGIGGATDTETGVMLLEAAAEAGLARAQYDLGGLLHAGMHTAQDLAAARFWFGEAAAQGDPFARFNLALMQYAGAGGPALPDEAFAHLRAAASAGVVSAQMHLAQQLATRPGATPEDRGEALKWFLIAAAFEAEGAAENAKRIAEVLPDDLVAHAKTAAEIFRPTSIVAP